MNSKLYLVDLPKKNTYAEEAFFGKKEYDFDNNYTLCPECGERVNGGYWMRPRSIVLSKRCIPDFLYVHGDRVDFVLSENALEAIQKAGLKGILKTEEIENTRFLRKARKEVEIPKYYHIELTYSRVKIDHEKSSIVYGGVVDPNSRYSQYCPLCCQVLGTYDFIRKLAFNCDEYEGYDIFHCYEMGHTVLLSQRFIDFYEQSGLKGLYYSPADVYGKDIADYFLGEEE